MVATRIPRFSPALRVIGFTLSIPAMLILVGATLFAVLTIGGSGKMAADASSRLRIQQANRLREVRGMPEDAIADFQDDGIVTDGTLSGLNTEQREAIERVTTSYAAAAAGAAVGSGAAAGIGGCGLVVLYFVLVPTLIVGFVLTLKKNVYRCGSCGFIFDRA